MGKEVTKEIGMQIISNLVQGGEWAFHVTWSKVLTFVILLSLQQLVLISNYIIYQIN